ncbi:MAG TPA: PEP-CTERM sorting domain-containing protein, partial [Vicinamibacterales bacterium]
ASEAQAVIVYNTTVQPFGINGTVPIDFNSDGQTDFELDHDRVDLNGTLLDYLQIDKNDINGETNPLAFDPGPDTVFAATPFLNGVSPRNDANEAAYVINGPQGSYPAALTAGTPIGPASAFDFQEGSNFQGSGKDIRANRLLDEDATQIDQVLGGQPASGVQVPFNGPNFDGLAGAVRYLGLKMDLNNAAPTAAGPFNYGWIGVRITNEADATGEVVGWGYETVPGQPIGAGQVPEPSSIILGLMGGALVCSRYVWKRIIGR